MGWKTVIGCGQCANDTVALSTNNSGNPFTGYGPIGGPICTQVWQGTAPTITPAYGSLNNHAAYTASGMALTIGQTSNSLSNDVVHQLLVNGVGGNQLATIQSFAHHGSNYVNLNVIQDASHSDVVPAGVPVSLSQGWSGTGPGSGSVIFTGVLCQADQPGGASVPLSATINNGANSGYGSSNTSAAHWLAPAGGQHALTASSGATVGWSQYCMPSSGVWSNLQMNFVNPLPGNPHTQTTTLKSCVSSAYTNSTTPTFGNQVLTIFGDVGLGILDDATGTDAVPAGSFINTQLVDTLGGNITFSGIGSTWTCAQPNVTPLTSGDGPLGGNANPNNRAQIGYTIFRPGATSTLEGPPPIPTAGSFAGLTVTVAVASASSAAFASMVSNVVGNQAAAFGSTMGSFSDLTHSDAMPAGGTFQNYFTNWPAAVTIASQTVNFRTSDGTGSFSMGLG